MAGVTLAHMAEQRENLRARRSRRPRKKVLKGVTPQKAVSLRYSAQLSYLIGLMHTATMEALEPVLTRWLAPSGFVQDELPDDLDDALKALRSSLGGLDPIIEEIASTFTASVDKVQRKKFFGSIEKAVGVDLRGVVSEEGISEAVHLATQQNVSLIKTLPERYFAQIENITYNEIIGGSLKPDVPFTAQIEALYDDAASNSRSNAKRIARDQNNKLSGDLSQVRQTNAGIEEYVWSASKDGDVRKSHKDHDGKTYRWDSPPKATGHPGHDIQCRCVALPVLHIKGFRKRTATR